MPQCARPPSAAPCLVPDLPPVPGKASTIARDCDYEYVRHGTVSILAGIDPHSGHLFANVEDRHRSVEFIALLKKLDEHYPPEAVVRVVLATAGGVSDRLRFHG